jgi:hypothetical protein
MNKNNLNLEVTGSEQFERFPVWDLTEIKAEPPSRYFALAPVDAGTGEVESLCSYIARLAEAHCVSPARILFYSVDEQARGDLPFSLQERSIPAITARTINGMGKTAETIGKLIETATSIPAIKYHTLLPWKHLISRHKLLDQLRAWCPACFNEQFHRHGFMYEKLVWSLNCVTVCPLHRTYLVNVCPYCRKTQKHLGNNSRSGFCAHCLKWLGRTEDYNTNILVNKKTLQALWIAGAAEKLLSCGTQLDPARHTPENFIANLKLCIEQICFGSINEFASMTETWHVTVRRLLKGCSMPTMEMLTRICFALDLAPESLFLNLNSHLPVGSACLPEVQNGMKNYSLKYGLPDEIKESKEQVTTYLEKILTENPPVSARETARRLGWRDSKLYRNYPDLYDRIVLRYKEFKASGISVTDEEAKEILRAAIEENPPPSLQSVLRRFGCKNTGYRYQQKFSWHCRYISRRFNSYRNQLLGSEETLNRFIENVTEEDPPPSASEVAERLGITRGHLHYKFPDQYRKIVHRYGEYVIAEREKTLKQLESEVEKAVRELIEENMYPSEERIKARLSCGYNDGNFKKVLFKIKSNIAIPFKSKY